MNSPSWKTTILVLLALCAVPVFIFGSVWGGEYFAYQELEQGLIKKTDIPTRSDAHRRIAMQIIGGVVVLIGLILTYWRTTLVDQQTQLTNRRIGAIEDGQVTERFTQAIEQLGSEKIAVRLGGIYALERIAKDSAKDHWTVMETLSAFVRERRPISDTADMENIETPTPDIQAAMTVIGRREATHDPPGATLNFEHTCLATLDLTRSNFSTATFFGANFFNAVLEDADLSEAILRSAHLKGASLSRCNLANADIVDAVFERAHLREACLNQVKGRRAKFNFAELTDAELRHADLIEAEFKESRMLSVNMPKARLTRANLEEALLNRSNLSDVDLTSAILKKACMDDANLQDAYLKQPNAEEIMIAGADLQGAFIRGGNWKSASIMNVNLQDAKIHGVDLREVRSLTGVDFCECKSFGGMHGKTKFRSDQEAGIKERCPDLLPQANRS